LLIIGAAQQGRQLRCEIRRLVELQPVAQRVENSLAGDKIVAYVPAKPVIQFINPHVGELNGVLEFRGRAVYKEASLGVSQYSLDG
jgi:hypothetical protein